MMYNAKMPLLPVTVTVTLPFAQYLDVLVIADVALDRYAQDESKAITPDGRRYFHERVQRIRALIATLNEAKS